MANDLLLLSDEGINAVGGKAGAIFPAGTASPKIVKNLVPPTTGLLYKKASVNTPNTGDSRNMMFFLILALASASCVFFFSRKKKRA